MGITLNLMAARQNPAQQTVVMWSGADATAKSLVLVVAKRRLDPEELEAAVLSGHPDADRVTVPATAGAVIDDLTGGGEARYYGVLAKAADGSFKPTRFRAGPMAELPEGSLKYSALGGKALAGSVPSATSPGVQAPIVGAGPTRGPFAASAEAPAAAGPTRGPFASAPEAAPAGPTRGAFAASAPEAAPAGPTRGPFAASASEAAPAGPTRGPFAASAPEAAPAGPTRGPFAGSAPEAAPAGPTRGPFASSAPAEEAPPPPRAAPSGDAVDARKAAQLRAQQAAAAALASSSEGEAPSRSHEEAAPVDPMEARRQAQQRARDAAAAATGGGSASSESAADPQASRRAAQSRAREPQLAEVAPPSQFPIERFGLPMVGATQAWDGNRILWESEGKAAEAYEVFISDHQLGPDEVGELIAAGELAGAFVRAFPSSVKAVIDNLTEREARSYYAVIARSEEGARAVVGCVAQGSDESNVKKAPFFDPKKLDEVRSLANGQVREAKTQLMVFQEDQDVGAWREALRLVGDALAIYPDFPAAMELKAQIESARK